MNIAYLAKTLETEELSEVVQNFDGVPLDMNLALWAAEDSGEVEINQEANSIKLLKDVQPESDEELRHKILRVIQHYAKNKSNITRGRLTTQMKDPISGKGYPWHDYIMAVQHLIDDGTVVQHVIDVPAKSEKRVGKKGKEKTVILRQAHKFAFLCLPENESENAEWNAKTVNDWIAEVESNSVK